MDETATSEVEVTALTMHEAEAFSPQLRAH
jgi:hypothetical protein